MRSDHRHTVRALLAVALAASTSHAQQLGPVGPRAPAESGAAPARPRGGESAAGEASLAALFDDVVGRPGGLTAERAGARAAATSPDVEGRRASVAAARAEVDRATVDYFPRLTLTARYTRLSPLDQPAIGPGTGSLVATPSGEGPLPPGAPLIAVPASAFSFPVILDQYLLQANVLVPLSDYLLRIGQKREAALATERARELESTVAERNSALRGSLAYYTWARARLERVVAVETLARAKEHVRVIGLARAAGRALEADLQQAEAQLAQVELVAARAESAEQVAVDRLRTLLRDPAHQRYEIGEPLFVDPDAGAAPNASELYKRAVKNRVELKALAQARVALERQSTAVGASKYPRLDAFGNANYANPNSRIIPPVDEWRATWDVGVQLTWSPNDMGTASSQQRALDAERERLLAEERSLRDAIRQEVVEASEAARRADAAVTAGEKAVRAAEASHRMRLALYEAGRATAAELLGAESDVLRARLELLRAYIERRLADVQIGYATGNATRAR